MKKFLICLCFIASGSIVNDAAVTKPTSSTTCGPLVRNDLYHFSRLEGGIRYYYLQSSFDNTSSTESWGAKVVFLAAHENPGLTYGESQPVLVNKGETIRPFYYARSTKRFGSINTNNLIDVTNNPYFRDNTVIEYCAPLSQDDLLFRAVRGRDYNLQRSPDLVNWQTFEVLRLPGGIALTENVIWRPKALMASDPVPDWEFYRAGAECFDATDFENESIRIANSQRELNAIYR